MYKHILVAVDLSAESWLLLEKAVSLARSFGSELSLFYDDYTYHDNDAHMIIDPSYAIENKVCGQADAQAHLKEILETTEYPIKSTLIGNGSFSEEIQKAIKELHIDLVICGHHHNLWHNISSSAQHMMKATSVDLLVVPLK
ncbi:universal stress protein [Vibrio mangrovi]|uniref:Universal stress protein n=1 Tax=Vibrio mangrovi TaxID=474394 RepID=A0A1Y6ITY4_9VIBR|nr:universal stress protein [Vibrio mangrovi]MDW6004807.1 universal stress protein [Vibrio mangrovi]SMS01098.1 Universal stress protein A [Vibrio mangrovi]